MKKKAKQPLEKVKALSNWISRAPAIFSYPVLYTEFLASQDENSQKIKKMLSAGIVERFGKCHSFNDEPRFEQYYAQHGFDANENLHGSSVDLDAERAKIKAIGECFERLSLIMPRTAKTINASFEELSQLKKQAINPAECLNFPDKYLPVPRKEYEEVLRKDRMKWVLGKNILDNSPAFLPYQLVFLPTTKEFGSDPLIRNPITTGTACGDSFEDAAYRGLMECVERDSNMLSWLAKREVPRIILDTKFFAEIEKYLARYSLKLFVWDFTTDIGIPSIMAVITDDSGLGPAVSAGTKADLNPSKAVTGAIYEALHSRFWIRSIYYTRKTRITRPSQIIDLQDRGLYWFDRKMLKNIDFLIYAKKSVKLSKMNDLSTQENSKLALAAKMLKQKNIESYLIDITLPAVKNAGFHVVRTIAPELHPMHLNENNPYHYSKRLEELLKGWKVNEIPAPFL
ncbi:MAG: YcaO-like family protein [Candidatus Diapherotrites archaeon]|nr:YcaO-like family protein [Candidatus Diapherotrites archaeon]